MEKYMNQFEQNHLILQQSIDQAIEKKQKCDI